MKTFFVETSSSKSLYSQSTLVHYLSHRWRGRVRGNTWPVHSLMAKCNPLGIHEYCFIYLAKVYKVSFMPSTALRLEETKMSEPFAHALSKYRMAWERFGFPCKLALALRSLFSQATKRPSTATLAINTSLAMSSETGQSLLVRRMQWTTFIKRWDKLT